MSPTRSLTWAPSSTVQKNTSRSISTDSSPTPWKSTTPQSRAGKKRRTLTSGRVASSMRIAGGVMGDQDAMRFAPPRQRRIAETALKAVFL